MYRCVWEHSADTSTGNMQVLLWCTGVCESTVLTRSTSTVMCMCCCDVQVCVRAQCWHAAPVQVTCRFLLATCRLVVRLTTAVHVVTPSVAVAHHVCVLSWSLLVLLSTSASVCHSCRPRTCAVSHTSCYNYWLASCLSWFAMGWKCRSETSIFAEVIVLDCTVLMTVILSSFSKHCWWLMLASGLI